MTPDDHRNIAHMLLCIRDRTPDPLDARVLGDAADALRQCAEQQPVAWGCRSPNGLIRHCIDPDEHAEHAGGYTIPLYAAPLPQPTEAQREPTVAQIVKGARALCALASDECGVDPDDNWKIYSEGFKEDARVVLRAALAAKEASDG